MTRSEGQFYRLMRRRGIRLNPYPPRFNFTDSAIPTYQDFIDAAGVYYEVIAQHATARYHRDQFELVAHQYPDVAIRVVWPDGIAYSPDRSEYAWRRELKPYGGKK